MAIAFSKYVDINSVVGATSAIQNRELIGRLISTNPLIPTGTVLEFTTASAVGVYFGTTSDEYLRASTAYFNYISPKNTRTPIKLSFARWADVDTAPQIFGAKLTTTLAQFQAINNGAFTLELAGVSHVISGLDFTATVSLAGVAAVIQTGIHAQSGTMWTAATVAYDNVRASFNFTGGAVGAASISATTAGTGTEILNLIGWGSTATFSYGADAQTVTDVLTESTDVSNNFGSFAFVDTLTLDQITEAAQWNNLPDNNVLFQYYVPVASADAATYSAALIDYAGVGLEISDTAGEYPEQAPMCVLATTNYAAINSVQNYMYQVFDFLTPSVTSTTVSDTLDSQRVNYYGQTQNAGQKINFFQRGVLMGTASDPTDMGVYANEQWLKDAAGVAIMSLFLGETRIPANPQGIGQIQAVLQTVIQQALDNGTISVGKPLTLAQKSYITTITGDNTAWQLVQNSGYWLKVSITVDLEAEYTLVYSKDDDIRKVTGTHVLI